MNHRERILKVIGGEQPDKTPMLFTSHFPQEQTQGKAAVEAHIRYFRESGNDICKVMNENQQRGVYKVEKPADLFKEVISEDSRRGMQRQADIISGVAQEIADAAPVILTVHGPMVSVQHMSGRPGFFVENLDFYHTCIKENPKALKAALDAAADGLCELVRRCFEAGAEGIYFAALGAQNSLFTDEEYADIVRPFDLRVLESAKSAKFNILHICASDLAVHRFIDYPVEIVNWEFGEKAKNPTMQEAFKMYGSDKTILGGLDNHTGPLIDGPFEAIEPEVHRLIKEAEGRRFILGAGCTLPNSVEAASLREVARASACYKG